MKRGGWSLVLVGMIGATLAHAVTRPAAPARGPHLESVTLSIRHRVYEDFRDAQRVKLNQDFILGDTDYSARVVQYVPEFTMDLKTRKVATLSDEPNNPAFRIIVRRKGVPQDTTWALFKMPPHFARKSFFAFRVVRIDFLNHPPVLADTTAPASPNPCPPSGGRSPAISPGSLDTTRKR